MIKPFQVEVPTTIDLTVRQAQIVPYLGTKPLRSWFDLDKMKNQDRYRYLGNGAKGDFKQLRNWANSPGKGGERREVIELHLPHQSWNDVKEHRAALLANPRYKAALYFVAGKNFNRITGHPDGTEMFVINDRFYRRLTWRSITEKFWDKKSKDAGIQWNDGDEFVYFLIRCSKINEEPLKSILIDGVGIELMERDRPKPKQEESQVGFPF